MGNVDTVTAFIPRKLVAYSKECVHRTEAEKHKYKQDFAFNCFFSLMFMFMCLYEFICAKCM